MIGRGAGADRRLAGAAWSRDSVLTARAQVAARHAAQGGSKFAASRLADEEARDLADNVASHDVRRGREWRGG